jgi:hypothetical protein
LTAANGGTVVENGTTSVAADVGVSHDVLFVDFYLNGQPAAVDRVAPFVLEFQALPQLGAPGSTIDVAAVATDASGNRGTKLVSTKVQVIPDQPPSATITSPAAESSAKNGDRIVVTVRATDDLGVKEIGYRAETGNPADSMTRAIASVSRDQAETFAFNVPASAEPGSTIVIRASATDSKGQIVSAVPAQITVLDAVPPVVKITGATTGSQVTPGQQTTVVVTATDAGGVASISFAASGVATQNEVREVGGQKSAVTSFTVTIPPTAQPGQELRLDATATDRAGKTGTAARVILPVADSKPPTLTLVPENGAATAVPGRPVRVVANATDESAVVSVNLSATGAVTFADAKQVTPPQNSASLIFEIPVPATAVAGSTIEVKATATDISKHTSAPATLTLTVVPAIDVTIPASQVVEAGESLDVPVSLSAAAPAGGTTVTFTTSNANVVIPAPGVTFAPGETAATVKLEAVAGGTAQVRALIGGVERATMTVTVMGGVVSGIVRDPMLTPMAGAHVTVTSGSTPFEAITDGDGRYRVGGVEGPQVSVRVTDPGTKLYGYSGGTMAYPRGSVSVNVVLIAAGSIAGRVFAPDGVTAVAAGVRVDIFGSFSTPMATTFTDADGRFEFPLVTLGNYTLQATSGLNRGRAAVSLTQSGQRADSSIVYLGAGIIQGTVRSNGAPVPNAKLTLQSWSIFGYATPTVASAQPDGTFTFAAIPVGGFSLTAESLATGQKGSVTGQVASHEQTVTADVNLAPYGAIAGTVYRADHLTVVAGATVGVSGNGYFRQTQTDATGKYRFDVVPFGTFTVLASDPGTHGSGSTTAVVNVADGTKTADIVFAPQGRLIVTVTDASGQPAPSAFIEVTSAGGDQHTATSSGDGKAVIEHVQAGSYTVKASFGSLIGVSSGTLTADETKTVTVALEPTGSFRGTVFGPVGQVPAAGATVSVLNWGINAKTDANGSFEISGLKMGRYSVLVYDSLNRPRARTAPVTGDIVLSRNGEVVTHDFTMIGLGTVVGRVVVSATGQSAANADVQLTPADLVGNSRVVRTDAGGFYRVDSVPVGAVKVKVNQISTTHLYGESFGSLAADGAELQLDITLTSSAITLPKVIWDANNRVFDVYPGGQLAQGSGYFTDWFNDKSGAFALDVISGATVTRFKGTEVPTIENSDREIVVRQENVSGLSITRKVFVPVDGYFARYLEILQNPTTTPITVDLRATSYPSGAASWVGDVLVSGPDVVRTDTWLEIKVNRGSTVPRGAAFVFDGAGGAMKTAVSSLSVVATFVKNFRFIYGWDGVTVMPGETIALMHFGVQQLTTDAAVASAQRLTQLPPEALAGMSAEEVAAVRNWVMPADGVSTVPPLPALDGTVTGRVFEANGVTPVPFATVRVRSTHPLFGETYQVGADGNGRFSIATRFRSDSFSNVVIPVAGFVVEATHPQTQRVSPPTSGVVDPQTKIGVRDIVFPALAAAINSLPEAKLPEIVWQWQSGATQ